MQVILFYNVVYVYVCKIAWPLLMVLFMVRSIQPGRLASALCLWLSQRIDWTTVSVLVNSKGNKKTAYWYCVLLYCCYKRMRNRVAYCCRDFVVNRRKALLANRLALCYGSWTNTRLRDVLLFQSADRSWVVIGCKDQDGPVHGVGDLARFPTLRPLYEETTNVKNVIVDAND